MRKQKNFSGSEKFMAGCRAIAGEAVSEISEELSMSQEYVYQQKDKVQQYSEQLDNTEA